jgi:hypothetical protein
MSMITTLFGLAPLVFIPGEGTELYRGVGVVVLSGPVVRDAGHADLSAGAAGRLARAPLAVRPGAAQDRRDGLR